MFFTSPIPCVALRRLEFLVGNFSGLEELHPPNGPSLQFELHSQGEWEASDRYVRLDLFGQASTVHVENIRSMIGFDVKSREYRMWAFSSSQDEPYLLQGNWDGDRLVLISKPTITASGTQKIRHVFEVTDDEHFLIESDYWTPEGWQLYSRAAMQRVSG